MPKYLLGYIAIAAAAIVAAITFGASATTVLIALAVLVCPAMMVFMMGSGHGGHGATTTPRTATTMTAPRSPDSPPRIATPPAAQRIPLSRSTVWR